MRTQAFILSTLTLCLGASGCFTGGDDPPAETCVPYLGTEWCAELPDAHYQDATGQWHDLTDPRTLGNPKHCSCLMPELADDLEEGLANPGAPPMGFQLAYDHLLGEAVAYCEGLASDLGASTNDCAAATPVFTEEGPCIDEYCEPAAGGDEAGAGNAPPPELGIASYSEVISCDGWGTCDIDSGFAETIEGDVTLLMTDDSRFAEATSSLGSAGLQLVAAGPGSLATALGLQVGDTVVLVDGQPLTGWADVLAAAPGVFGAPQVSIVVHRGRGSLTFTYVRAAP